MGNRIPLGVLRHYHHEFGPMYGEDMEGALVRVLHHSPERGMYYVEFEGGKGFEGGWVYETELGES